jgi:hypothetical protein
VAKGKNYCCVLFTTFGERIAYFVITFVAQEVLQWRTELTGVAGGLKVKFKLAARLLAKFWPFISIPLVVKRHFSRLKLLPRIFECLEAGSAECSI